MDLLSKKSSSGFLSIFELSKCIHFIDWILGAYFETF